MSQKPLTQLKTVAEVLDALATLREELSQLRAERDRLKEENERAWECEHARVIERDTARSDNARLAAEVEELKNLCEKHCADIASAEDQVTDWQAEASRLTAELEAARKELSSYPVSTNRTREEARELLGPVSRHDDGDGASHGCVEAMNAKEVVDTLIAEKNKAAQELEAAKGEMKRIRELDEDIEHDLQTYERRNRALADKVRELREKLESLAWIGVGNGVIKCRFCKAPQGAHHKPSCILSTPPDTQGGEKDELQQQADEFYFEGKEPNETHGEEKEYRMLDIKEMVEPGDEFLTREGRWITVRATKFRVGVFNHKRYRRPITPPTETGGELCQ